MVELNVNIDHVATLREARKGVEPEPVTAALIAELSGASGVVCHLREDRRHINDRDLKLIREVVTSKLDMEMAAVEEIIKIALDVKPDMVTIVPEKREELTTEGGLNVADFSEKYKSLVDRMHEKDISVSFFIEPEERQIESVFTIGGDMVEFHTGTYSNKKNEKEQKREFDKIKKNVLFAKRNNLRVAAGHGLNYLNVKPIAQIPGISELSIGHSIMARAIFVGLEKAIKEMIEIINTASADGFLRNK